MDLAFDPATGVLAGTATIDARAEQTLTRFDLDLRGFDVSTISVNGRRGPRSLAPVKSS